MFTVYLKSAGGTKKYFTEFETEAEAESFCREYGWEWVDENEFVWDMDYQVEHRRLQSIERRSRNRRIIQMAKIYRNKAGKKLYPVCKWEDNQHKIYNAHDRIMIRIYEAQENGGEDLEALYKEQERIEKALELIDACVIDGLVYATYEDGLILKDLIWAYNARH